MGLEDLSCDQSCCIQGSACQPLFNDSMAGSGTAYLYAGEGKGNENLSGKECRIRGGGAICRGEQVEGVCVEGGKEGGCQE